MTRSSIIFFFSVDSFIVFIITFIITLTSWLVALLVSRHNERRSRTHKPYSIGLIVCSFLSLFDVAKVKNDENDACLSVISVEIECFMGSIVFFSPFLFSRAIVIRRNMNPRRTHTVFELRVKFVFNHFCCDHMHTHSLATFLFRLKAEIQIQIRAQTLQFEEYPLEMLFS